MDTERSLADFIATLSQVVFLAIPFAFVLLAFFWNLFQLLATVSDAEKKKQARERMIWSVIALFVLFSLAGIVAMLQNTFFGPGSTTAEPGAVQIQGGN